MGQGNVYISCNYSCTISFVVEILLVKLKYLYIKYAWISKILKKNKILNKTGWKDGGTCQNFWSFPSEVSTFSTVL